MEQTAVEWLVDKVIEYQQKGLKISKNLDKLVIEQAKEMEKQQQDEFAIGFAEWLANSYYSYNFGIKMFQHRNKEIYKTTKELLEIYKKEKGL
jgi:hypothetical protein